MARVKQKKNGKGSLKNIQLLINNKADLLNEMLYKETQLIKSKIEWLSPLEIDDFSEYSDINFLKLLGLPYKEIDLQKFWPPKGPQWDALGKTKNNEVLLVEAKANLPELASSGTKASSKSLDLIKSSLNKTKSFLNITNQIDWSKKYYQYTNRLAHLYYLREVKKIPTFLVFIYFINDKTVNGPRSKEEWLNAIEITESYLGLDRHILSDFVIKIFIDYNELS